MKKNFWNGKTVVVTGHTGFKGGWLCLWLQSMGARVIGVARPPHTDPSIFNQAQVESGMESHYVDVNDFRALRDLFVATGPEIVFHLAAQALVRKSYSSPLETYLTNVMGTANVLEAVRSAGTARAIVVVTSDKCYENMEWPWGYREVDALGGYDPYSSSKACAEILTAAMRRSFFSAGNIGSKVGVATARAGNVIGGGDWSEDRLVPDLVRGFSEGTLVNIRRPEALRPWQHVLDALAGYLLLAEQLFVDDTGRSAAWNFGPHEQDVRSVRWVADRMVSLWGGSAAWKDDSSSQAPHEANLLKLDSSRARTLLGWQPKWGIDRALSETIAWYAQAAAGLNMRETTLRQIEEYCKCK